MQPSSLSDLSSLLQSSYSISIDQLIYNNSDSVSVYSALMSSSHSRVVVKIQRYSNSKQYSALMNEIKHLEKLKDHPNVVKIIGSLDYFSEANGMHYAVIVCEHCQKDLMKDINQRMAAGRFNYTEEEMWKMVYALVDVFAYMESLGIAHRDIKPQNIFLDGKVVKIGDFGSSITIDFLMTSYSTVGTPIFLSPLLKQALLQRDSKVCHNVYKSDVWSLGLTLLTMAMLEQPSIGLFTGGEQEMEICISSLIYSPNFKSLLRLMLQFQEDHRSSFLGLYYLLHPQPPVPVEDSPSPPVPDPEPTAIDLTMPDADLTPNGTAWGVEEINLYLEDSEENERTWEQLSLSISKKARSVRDDDSCSPRETVEGYIQACPVAQEPELAADGRILGEEYGEQEVIVEDSEEKREEIRKEESEVKETAIPGCKEVGDEQPHSDSKPIRLCGDSWDGGDRGIEGSQPNRQKIDTGEDTEDTYKRRHRDKNATRCCSLQ